jgi:hypothetical protein
MTHKIPDTKPSFDLNQFGIPLDVQYLIFVMTANSAAKRAERRLPHRHHIQKERIPP